MAQGRKAEAAEVKRAKGNPGRRRIGETPEVAELGAVPAELSTRGADVWKRLAPELERLKFLRLTDRGAFARYCEHLAGWWKLTEELRLEGETYLAKSEHVPEGLMRVNPKFMVRERLEKRLEFLEDRFGLSPSARQQILYRLSLANMAPPPGELPMDMPQQQPTAEESPIGLLN